MHHTDTNPKPPSGAPADHAQPSGLATVSGLVGRRVPDAGDGPMQRAWEARRAGSSLTCEQARAAMRAAWHRVDVDLSDVAPR